VGREVVRPFKHPLAETAYVARAVRHMALVHMALVGLGRSKRSTADLALLDDGAAARRGFSRRFPVTMEAVFVPGGHRSKTCLFCYHPVAVVVPVPVPVVVVVVVVGGGGTVGGNWGLGKLNLNLSYWRSRCCRCRCLVSLNCCCRSQKRRGVCRRCGR
jgi:hypothetical protein